jgi:hypothetical protein
MEGVPIVLYLRQPGQCRIAGRAICAALAGRTEKGAVLESRLQAPAVVPVQAESQSWDTSEVDFEGQGSMEVPEIEIEIG